jgi:hypothetical protein
LTEQPGSQTIAIMPAIVLKYRSGEEIIKGDHVRFHGYSGRIELVAVDAEDPEQRWYVEEFGGGIRVTDPIAGSTFIPADQIDEYEDMEFVSRAQNHG